MCETVMAAMAEAYISTMDVEAHLLKFSFIYDHPRMRHCNVFSIVCLSVCLSVHLCLFPSNYLKQFNSIQFNFILKTNRQTALCITNRASIYVMQSVMMDKKHNMNNNIDLKR